MALADGKKMKTVAELEAMNVEQIGCLKMSSGKFKGKTVLQASRDSAYMAWVLAHTDRNMAAWSPLWVYYAKSVENEKNGTGKTTKTDMTDSSPNERLQELEERVQQMEQERDTIKQACFVQ